VEAELLVSSVSSRARADDVSVRALALGLGRSSHLDLVMQCMVLLPDGAASSVGAVRAA
jgi:hypothetical protein